MMRIQVFGARLKEERFRLGLSQRELATIGGVTRTSQMLYEKGTRPPTAEYLMRIMEAGVDMDRLLPAQKRVQAEHARRFSEEAKDRMTIRRSSLHAVLTLADKIGRDRKGRLLDLELRNALTEKILDALAEQPGDEVDWDKLESKARRQAGRL